MPCSKECICLNHIEISDDTSDEEAFLAFLCDKHLENANFSERQLRFCRDELTKIIDKLDRYDLLSKIRNLELDDRKVSERQTNNSPLKGRHVTFAEDNKTSSFPAPSFYGSTAKATPVTNFINEEMSSPRKALPGSVSADHVVNTVDGYPRMSSSSLPDDDERIVFNDFVSNSKKYLRLRRIAPKNDQLDHVNGPLGLCFDESLQQWIIADTNNSRILLYPSQISITTELIGTPSAVCVVEPEICFAILSNSHIVTFDHRSNKFKVLWEDNHLNCRGLAISPNGNLVTMRKIADSVFIVVLSSTIPNKQYALLPLKGVNPSFLHMVGDTLIFTDLGNQSVSKCLLDDSDVNKISLVTEFTHDGYKWEGESEEPHGKFSFVSGVQIDGRGWSLLGDAGGHTIQLFDDKLNPMYRVSADFSLPYMSAFAVNNGGQMMICGRQNGHLCMAQLEAASEILPRMEKVNFRTTRGRGQRFRGSNNRRHGN